MRPDLKLHTVGGYLIGLYAALAGLLFFALSPGQAVVVGTLVGCAKELLWDLLLKRGTPDGDDAFYTCAGSVAGGMTVAAGILAAPLVLFLIGA